MNLSGEMTQGMPESRGRKPTAFIVDDVQDVRESLRALIESAGFEAKSYSSAEGFLSDYSTQLSGCLVLDVRMAGMSGLELQEKLVELNCDLPIIMVTGYGDIPMAVHAIQAGALDFLCKPYSPQVMLNRVQQALDKNAERQAERANRASIEARLATLSRREHEVAELLVDGNSTKKVAKVLGISPKTVDNHRAKVLDKCHVDNPVALRKLLVS